MRIFFVGTFFYSFIKVINRFSIACGIVVFMFGQQSYGQPYPQNDFVSPLHIPLYLAGVFGECRATHFHAGMDIKTNQVEGLSVFSIGDGYVSRIKVSATGYGNALYITHSNGYTSVYGHLQSFSDEISKYIQDKQWENKSFEVDLYLPKNFIRVYKNQEVAKSGNTGGSGGPHLHFEIRDSFENALNPQLFGIKIIDKIKPEISGIAFINMDNARLTTPAFIRACKNNDTVQLNTDDLALAVEVHDRMDGSSGNNGVYFINMKIDGITVFNYTMDKFHFDETRNVVGYVNQLIKQATNRSFQDCFVMPNQHFNCFKEAVNRGIINIDDAQPHKINIEVGDFQNNFTYLYFYIQKNETSLAFKRQNLSFYRVIYPFKAYDYVNDNLSLHIPENALFDTLPINYNKTPTNGLSSIYTIGKSNDLFFAPISIGINANKVPADLLNKTLLLKKNGPSYATCGGTLNDGFVYGKTTSFGSFLLGVDTTAPVLRSINLINNKIMSKETYIKFALSDNLSGVKKYEGYIDNNWVLFEYDAKSNLLRYKIDIPAELKSHQLVLKVVDERSNEKTYLFQFIY